MNTSQSGFRGGTRGLWRGWKADKFNEQKKNEPARSEWDYWVDGTENKN